MCTAPAEIVSAVQKDETIWTFLHTFFARQTSLRSDFLAMPAEPSRQTFQSLLEGFNPPVSLVLDGLDGLSLQDLDAISEVFQIVKHMQSGPRGLTGLAFVGLEKLIARSTYEVPFIQVNCLQNVLKCTVLFYFVLHSGPVIATKGQNKSFRGPLQPSHCRMSRINAFLLANLCRHVKHNKCMTPGIDDRYKQSFSLIIMGLSKA